MNDLTDFANNELGKCHDEFDKLIWLMRFLGAVDAVLLTYPDLQQKIIEGMKIREGKKE